MEYSYGRPQVATNQQQYLAYGNQSANSASMYYQQQTGSGLAPAHSSQPAQYQHHFQQVQSANNNVNMDYNSGHQQQSMSSSAAGGGGGAARRSTPRGNGDSTHGHTQASSHLGGGPAPVRVSAPVGNQGELPLRIIVDSRHVGAVIGTGGSNIREISKESKARVVVDVHRVVKDQQGHSEKMITIMGFPDSCTKACVRIMHVIQREVEKDEHRESSDVELKIRAPNQLVGRLIGKQGATIKKIMQETGTTIFVSNEQSRSPSDVTSAMSMLTMGPHPDLYNMNLERVITVKGPSIDAVSSAEQKISTKLRQSYETDIQNRAQAMQLAGPMAGMTMMPMSADPYMALSRPMPPINAPNQMKNVRLWVPNTMVGAIIGAKGSNIRTMIRNSGANIRIEGSDRKEKDEETTEPAAAPESGDQKNDDNKEKIENGEERLVTITGNDAQQCRAQFWIFQRVAEQSHTYLDEVKLRIEVHVPSKLIGRIIGKGGQNVRELQRITGASVKVPEEEGKSGEEGEAPEEKEQKEVKDGVEQTTVRITGNYHAAFSVQVRIGQLVAEFLRQSNSERRRDDDAQGGSGSARKSSPPAANGNE